MKIQNIIWDLNKIPYKIKTKNIRFSIKLMMKITRIN